MIGKKISKYEIESKLGQGGMGVVYKARDLTLPRHVAIKLLPPFMSTEGDARVRFEDEAKTTAALNHPNIADIYETGETDDGQLYIVMPLYEGRTLQDVLDEGPVDLDRALDLFMQLATGLAKAHEKGIVHRDIKPDNVFVTEDGFVKILDFGLARFAHSTRRTATGVSVGTVQYMSPEQARGDNAGPASDVFALGEILYQLVSGEYPFQAEHNQAILYKIMNEDPAPLTQTGVPDYVLRVIDGALEKDPADRFVDAAELLRVLKGGVPTPRKASKRPRWLMPAAIAIVAVLAVAYLVFRGPGAGGPEEVSQATLEEVTPGALVVFPFTVRGSEEAGYLREGMVDLINVGLNDVAGIFPVDPRAVHQALQRDTRGPEDESMLRITRTLGATMYIDGNVIEAGGRYQANANLYGVDGNVMVVATARVDTEAELFDLAEEIARQVIVAYAGADAAAPRRLETNLAALKPFLRAEQLMRSGNFVDAMPLYQQSVAADSLFALGWMRYSLVTGYTEYTDISRDAAVRAMELSDQLSESELLKTRAQYHLGFGQLEEAMTITRSLLQTHPHDPDVWFIYGDAIFHSWPMRGGDGVESYQSFLRAVENGMPRTDYGFMFHLRAAAAWGDLEAYNEILDELIVLQPHGDLANWVHAEIGAWRDDPDEWARGLGGLLGDPDWLLLGCANSFAIYQQRLDPAREVALLLTDPRRAPTIRAQGHLTAAFIDAARGRLGAAQEQVELAMANDPIYAAEYVALLSLMPLPDAKERQQAALATVLGANIDGYRPDPSLDPWSDSHAGLHDIVLATARASLYLRLDRVEDAAAEARTLESYEGEELAVETARGLAEGIRAELALAAGDTATAIELLERTWIAGQWERVHMTGYFSRARERLVIARVYAALDDVENALRWYNTAGRMSGYDAIFMAPSYLESAALLERHGRTEEAAGYYTRFIELWDGCDEALAPQVADARQRLSQL